MAMAGGDVDCVYEIVAIAGHDEAQRHDLVDARVGGIEHAGEVVETRLIASRPQPRTRRGRRTS